MFARPRQKVNGKVQSVYLAVRVQNHDIINLQVQLVQISGDLLHLHARHPCVTPKSLIQDQDKKRRPEARPSVSI